MNWPHTAITGLPSIPQVEAREILTGSKLLDQARALADDFEAVAGSGNAAVLYCLLRDIAARSMEASRISSEGQAAGGGDVPVETLLDAPSEISGLEALVFTDARGEGSSCTPLMESVSLPLSSEALATVQLQELPGGGVAALLEPMADKGVRTVRSSPPYQGQKWCSSKLYHPSISDLTYMLASSSKKLPYLRPCIIFSSNTSHNS